MKNLSKVVMVITFTIFAFAASAQSDNSLIGRARIAAKECLDVYNGNNFIDVGANVETVGICFVSGELKRVNFYAGPNCLPNNKPCPSFATRLVATVDFDCEGNIIAVTCL